MQDGHFEQKVTSAAPLINKLCSLDMVVLISPHLSHQQNTFFYFVAEHLLVFLLLDK